MARKINDRIKWFLGHLPGRAGLCLQHTHNAISLPAAGMDTANDAVKYLRDNKKLYKGSPPRGAMVLWTSSKDGHAALSLGKIAGADMIVSTDINGPNTVGRTTLSHITNVWGYTYAGWSDWYAGETYDVGEDEMPLTDRDVQRIANAAAKAVWDEKIPADPASTAKNPIKRTARWLLGTVHQSTKKAGK